MHARCRLFCHANAHHPLLQEYRTFQTGVLATISATLFLRVHMQRTSEHANLYEGFLFFALLVVSVQCRVQGAVRDLACSTAAACHAVFGKVHDHCGWHLLMRLLLGGAHAARMM